MSAPSPAELLALAREAVRMHKTWGHQGGFAHEAKKALHRAATPAVIAALCQRLKDTEATLVAREQQQGLHRGPTFPHAMTAPLEVREG